MTVTFCFAFYVEGVEPVACIVDGCNHDSALGALCGCCRRRANEYGEFGNLEACIAGWVRSAPWYDPSLGESFQ